MIEKRPYSTPEVVSLGGALELTESNSVDNMAEVAGGPWRRGEGVDEDAAPAETESEPEES